MSKSDGKFDNDIFYIKNRKAPSGATYDKLLYYYAFSRSLAHSLFNLLRKSESEDSLLINGLECEWSFE